MALSVLSSMEDFPSVRPNAISFNSVTQMQKALGRPDAMVDMDVGQNGRPIWDHRCECLV